jgi:hypothetical protein
MNEEKRSQQLCMSEILEKLRLRKRISVLATKALSLTFSPKENI